MGPKPPSPLGTESGPKPRFLDSYPLLLSLLLTEDKTE